MISVGPVLLSNPKAWTISGLATAAGIGLMGPFGALVAIPALAVGGFVTAMGGNAMFQLKLR